MTPEERKAALGRGGQAAVARETGFSAVYVHEVVEGKKDNALIQRTIARRIKRPVRDVFPRRRRRGDAPAVVVAPESCANPTEV